MFAGLSAWLVLAYADDPGTAMLLFALVIVGGAVVTLLMVVMRALLHRATRLNTELEGSSDADRGPAGCGAGQAQDVGR